ncbi:hypothetical protein KSP40_PGU020353 [Platanthera guangdongensis]|uniref:GAT domain-containing protein n=1 Tax=Platanthera guangdongensis TaxID=2320717 RepID=A0ABR2M3K4_9ASPA
MRVGPGSLQKQHCMTQSNASLYLAPPESDGKMETLLSGGKWSPIESSPFPPDAGRRRSLTGCSGHLHFPPLRCQIEPHRPQKCRRIKIPYFYHFFVDLFFQRAGMTFPKRAEMPATIFQSRRPTSYPYPTRNYDKIATKTEGQVDSDITILSFSDIQNARGVMEVLVEMLNSLEPKNNELSKEGRRKKEGADDGLCLRPPPPLFGGHGRCLEETAAAESGEGAKKDGEDTSQKASESSLTRRKPRLEERCGRSTARSRDEGAIRGLRLSIRGAGLRAAKRLRRIKRQGDKQQVIVELVEQCRLYRQRVVHLVNSTSDEELLLHCLSLNDDLQNVLAKYDSLATGVSNKEPKKQKSLQALVDIDVLYNKNQDDNNESDQRSSASGSTSNQAPLQQLLLPATSGSHIDLLSGDDFGAVSAENSLVLVPANETTGASLEKAQNMLVISSAYSPRNSVKNNYLANKASSELVCASDSQFQQQDQILPHTNGSFSNHGGSVYEQGPSVQSNHAYPSWNNQFSHSGNMQHQVQTGELDQGGSLPPPPWETEPAESIQHDQAYDCHNAYSHSAHSSQVASYNYGQRSDSQFYGHNTAYSYSNATEISHRMYGLSMQDNAYKNAQQIPTHHLLTCNCP